MIRRREARQDQKRLYSDRSTEEIRPIMTQLTDKNKSKGFAVESRAQETACERQKPEKMSFPLFMETLLKICQKLEIKDENLTQRGLHLTMFSVRIGSLNSQ